MGLYKNGVSTGFRPSIVTWKLGVGRPFPWTASSQVRSVQRSVWKVVTPSSSSSFILNVCPSWGTFHDSVSKFGSPAGSPCCYFLCMSDLGLQWWDVLARLGSTSQCLVMLSFFFLKIHQSKSWKWRIEPLAASYQFKDSFLSPSSHNFSMLRLQCSLLGLELECLKPCRVSYDFTKQTPAGAQGEWMLRPRPHDFSL